MKYQGPIKLFANGEYELNQKCPHHLSWMKISKILQFCAVFSFITAQAKEPPSYPEIDDGGEFSLMGALSNFGLHNLQNERWNAYAQGTYIMSFKQAFPAAYTNLNGTPQLIVTQCRARFYRNIYCIFWA